MNSKHLAKISLLIITLWPMYYFLIFIPTRFQALLDDSMSFDDLTKWHIFTMVSSLGLLVYYIGHLYKAKHLTANSKIIWTIGILTMGFLTMPIYWFKNIWPEHVTRKNKPKRRKGGKVRL